MVTLTANGTGSAGIPAKLGVVAMVVLDPFWNVTSQEPVRVGLNAVAVAQKFGLTVRPPHRAGPTVTPCTPVIDVPETGMTASAPNSSRSPSPIPTSLSHRVSRK